MRNVMEIVRKGMLVLLVALAMAWSPAPVVTACDMRNENECFKVISTRI